jgi:hypothetical protein
MTRVAKNFLVLCLLALPTAALADIYQLTPPPDIYVDNITANGLTMTGTVESIGDALNTGCYSGECSIGPLLTFSSTSSGFTISGGTIAYPYGTATYLAASYVPGSYLTADGGEAGIEYLVTYDNVDQWTALEQYAGNNTGDTQSATNLSVGTEMVLDYHGDATDADMTPAGPPAATPEPATLTLLCSGMAAGLLRKRLARKKA